MLKENHRKYLQLREEYPFLSYDSVQWQRDDQKISIKFLFNLSDSIFFEPEWEIPICQTDTENLSDEDLSTLIFHIGMVELISYWKVACPFSVIIRPYQLTKEQLKFWKKLYFKGMGEFFHTNGIPADNEGFMELISQPGRRVKKITRLLREGYIIPVGGGKDSAVTLEILKNSGSTCVPYCINPRPAVHRTIEASGIDSKRSLFFRRALDPRMLELNKKGYLNGHTPFSALVAFSSLLAAYLTGLNRIALSNESSANEPTIPGTEINHQYSKSFEFETDFRQYVNQFLLPGVEYFSFLRPLSELQIASIFADMSRYHPVFRSCNVGSKEDKWCGKCAKCLFAYIILSPFLSEDEMIAIFGSNLFEDQELKEILEDLAGISDSKPFECIGTIDEVNLALTRTIRQYGDEQLPLLLRHYKQNSQLRDTYADFHSHLLGINKDNYLNDTELSLLLNRLKDVTGV